MNSRPSTTNLQVGGARILAAFILPIPITRTENRQLAASSKERAAGGESRVMQNSGMVITPTLSNSPKTRSLRIDYFSTNRHNESVAIYAEYLGQGRCPLVAGAATTPPRALCKISPLPEVMLPGLHRKVCSKLPPLPITYGQCNLEFPESNSQARYVRLVVCDVKGTETESNDWTPRSLADQDVEWIERLKCNIGLGQDMAKRTVGYATSSEKLFERAVELRIHAHENKLVPPQLSKEVIEKGFEKLEHIIVKGTNLNVIADTVDHRANGSIVSSFGYAEKDRLRLASRETPLPDDIEAFKINSREMAFEANAEILEFSQWSSHRLSEEIIIHLITRVLIDGQSVNSIARDINIDNAKAHRMVRKAKQHLAGRLGRLIARVDA